MAFRNVACQVAEILRWQGVKYVFSVSGESILPIYDACQDVGISIIHTRQESAAVCMADGWARVTGQPGVCLVTLGAGVANTLGGMSTAALDGSPLVLLAGRCSTTSWGTDSFGEFDAASVLRSVAKHTQTVVAPSRVADALAYAFRAARAGRPGPVLLEIPFDVLTASLPSTSAESSRNESPLARPLGEPKLISQAVEALRTARRPVLLAGSGVWWSGAGDALCALAEAAELPCFIDRMAMGLLPRHHRLYFGPLAVSVNPALRQAAAECDLVLMVGGRFDFDLRFGQPFPRNRTRIIQIDIESAEIGRGPVVDSGIVGDARITLERLLSQLSPDAGAAARRTWVDHLRRCVEAHRRELEPALRSESRPIHPLRLCHEISDFLDDNANIALGGGDIYSFGRMMLHPSPPGRLLRAHRNWALGSEIPFAIAAKLARPAQQALALCGDGSFGYSGMEIETAARYGLNIVCVVANDGGWSMMKWPQRFLYGADRVYATELAACRYDVMAEALGGYGELVTEPGQIRPALERAFTSGRPAGLNIITESVPSPDTMWSYPRLEA